MFGKPSKLMLLLNLGLLAVLIFLVHSSWKRARGRGRRVQISPIVRAIHPPIVVKRDGEPIYVERGRAADLQLTAAAHSNSSV